MHGVSKYWIILMVNSCSGEARGKDKKEGKQIKDCYVVQLNSICNAIILKSWCQYCKILWSWELSFSGNLLYHLKNFFDLSYGDSWKVYSEGNPHF